MFDRLKVGKIVKETEDTISIYFDIPNDLRGKYSFKAGQYLTIKANIAGEEIRRSYSISTAPHAASPAVSIKRIYGGRMSNYLHDQLTAGQLLDILAPEGKFTVLPDAALARDHYFFAAGSGITPVMSMIQDVLEHEPKSSCHLMYGSRSEKGIIFHNVLDNLAKKHEGQLSVSHTISQPTKVKARGIGGLLGKKSISWKGDTGRIDIAKVTDFLAKNPSYTKAQLYYICGPGTMISNVEGALLEQSISKDLIKKEYFGGASEAKTKSAGPLATGSSIITVKLNSEVISLSMDNSKTILDELIDLGKEPPYSCTSGACSTCIAKVTSGDVKMDACFALDDDEISDGYILTCQARPETQEVTIEFEG